MLRDDEPEQHSPRDLKNALLGVEFDVVHSKLLKSLLQVYHKLVGLFGLDYDVIHVSFNGLPDEVLETLEHTMLVCKPRVF
jgi:hypothetical protein